MLHSWCRSRHIEGLVGNTEGKRQFKRYKCRWKGNSKRDHKVWTAVRGLVCCASCFEHGDEIWVSLKCRRFWLVDDLLPSQERPVQGVSQLVRNNQKRLAFFLQFITNKLIQTVSSFSEYTDTTVKMLYLHSFILICSTETAVGQGELNPSTATPDENQNDF